MANDMKPKTPPRGGGGGGGRPGMNPLFAGIIIGLLMGIFLALGVAIWLNRTSNPFVEKTRPVESLPAAKPSPQPTNAANKSGDPTNPDKPRFEFYQILPGEKDGGGKKAVEPAPKDAVKTPAAAKELTKEPAKELPKEQPKDSVPMKSLNETLYLQAGAFQSEGEAENLKAKIAFSGFEATVKPVNVAGKGTLYRVRLGPYKSQEEVNRIKGVLSQAGIGAAVVKPE
jgi:cell division protein FtsN